MLAAAVFVVNPSFPRFFFLMYCSVFSHIFPPQPLLDVGGTYTVPFQPKLFTDTEKRFKLGYTFTPLPNSTVPSQYEILHGFFSALKNTSITEYASHIPVDHILQGKFNSSGQADFQGCLHATSDLLTERPLVSYWGAPGFPGMF